MKQEQINLRKKVLPWPGDVIANLYTAYREPFVYGEKFVELIFESYRAYLAGCPRASIITAGEALFRILCFKVAEELCKNGDITINKRKLILSKDNVDHLFYLYEHITYDEILSIIKQKKMYSVDFIKQMYTVKGLRNYAAHGEFPILDEWDPDDPRPKDQFLALIDGEIEIPEGYRFHSSRKSKEWFTFACRDYNCSSLKGLSVENRYAVIQLALVFNIISKISN